jgi:hypothetical protein
LNYFYLFNIVRSCINLQDGIFTLNGYFKIKVEKNPARRKIIQRII